MEQKLVKMLEEIKQREKHKVNDKQKKIKKINK